MSKVLKVEKIKEVLPPNYEADMKRLKQLEKQCNKLQNLIDYGNISNLQTLIEQFTVYARVQLKKISVELQFTEYGNVEGELIEEFIHYLGDIKDELNVLACLKGDLRGAGLSLQCKKEMDDIENKFRNIEQLAHSEYKLKELFFTLQSFNEILDSFDEVQNE